MPSVYRWGVLVMFKRFIKVLLMFLGFGTVIRTKHSIFDFIPDYEPQQDLSKAPITISNHVSYLDMFYYLSHDVSLLSKRSVGKSFFIGMFAVAKQCLFVDRSSEAERNTVMEKIQNRIEQGMKGDLPSLLIFPEGTVTNGRCIMSFKKGAFMHDKPIKIFCLKYKGDFVSSLSNVLPLPSIMLTITQTSNVLEVCEVEEPLDPLWVFKKYGVDKNDPEAWRYVAREAKELMCFMTGYQSVETSFRDITEFENNECNKYDQFNFKLCSHQCKEESKAWDELSGMNFSTRKKLKQY